MSKKKQQSFLELTFSSRDGLRLTGRHYKAVSTNGATQKSPFYTAAQNPVRPLLCLSSLAGNSSEFHQLGLFLSRHIEHPRDVFCIDYRGRGHSQADFNAANYTPYVELQDILDFLITFDIPHFDVIGSSRGGINAMLLASVRPASLGRIILNDLGPVLEPAGITRLMGFLADMPTPLDWADADEIMYAMYQSRFPTLADADWRALSLRFFKEDKGRLTLSYDPRIARAYKYLDLTKTIPDMWRQYLALLNHNLLIIRGENSDMLSRKTVEDMRTLHWKSKVVTVPGQGHSPLLRDKPSLRTISEFLR